MHEEATIAELADAGASSRQLVEWYLERIANLDQAGPRLRSVLEINPEALSMADALDRERAERGSRGPLHGMPILLKDNIDTADRMQTTAGSLALLDARVQRDAGVAHLLRAAGAVILGKTNLSEWANFRSTRSSSGWSARGRQTGNPYVLDRTPCGSSAGSAAAVSANLAVAALGTETDGSIISPSSACGVVGIKPTVGLTSRAGVIPIAHSQDTVGPHARTVADAAAVLGALTGVDERDVVARASEPPADYTPFLRVDGLRGAHIGVARRFHTGYSEHTDAVFERALQVLREQGAELTDDVEIPGEAELRADLPQGDAPAERIILEYELKSDLEAYLATRPDASVRTLADVIRFNEEHAAEEMPYFGQERFLSAQKRGPLTDDLYRRALEHARGFTQGFAGMLREGGFDALVAPSLSPAWVMDPLSGDRILGGASQAAAVAGFPIITVPAGYVREHLPVGINFIGAAWSEPVLIRLAYAFEQASKVRRAPRFLPRLDLP